MTIAAGDVPTGIKEITEEKADYLLSRAVEERGADYVYQRPQQQEVGPACLYRHYRTGEPDCLIALALSYIGPIPENNWGGADEAVMRLYPKTKRPVRTALLAAQQVQDQGGTWGAALARFRTTLATAKKFQ